MHSLLLVLMVAISLGIRWQWQPAADIWNHRWNQALSAFCLPPLLLIAAAIAVLLMGHHGHMMGLPVSPLGCWVGITMLVLVSGVAIYSLLKSLWVELRLQRYPWIVLPTGGTARLLDTTRPFAAQVGVWRPCLVVSRGWLVSLNPDEQRAILRHEQAHRHFRDPFWFFWLGIIRRLTWILPCTASLWEELLLLREIRADRWAARETDPLLLAELLVKLVRDQVQGQDALSSHAVGFSDAPSVQRLEQRIEALLNPHYFAIENTPQGELGWLVYAVIPLMIIWLHG